MTSSYLPFFMLHSSFYAMTWAQQMICIFTTAKNNPFSSILSIYDWSEKWLKSNWKLLLITPILTM